MSPCGRPERGGCRARRARRQRDRTLGARPGRHFRRILSAAASSDARDSLAGSAPRRSRRLAGGRGAGRSAHAGDGTHRARDGPVTERCVLGMPTRPGHRGMTRWAAILLGCGVLASVAGCRRAIWPRASTWSGRTGGRGRSSRSRSTMRPRRCLASRSAGRTPTSPTERGCTTTVARSEGSLANIIFCPYSLRTSSALAVWSQTSLHCGLTGTFIKSSMEKGGQSRGLGMARGTTSSVASRTPRETRYCWSIPLS